MPQQQSTTHRKISPAVFYSLHYSACRQHRGVGLSVKRLRALRSTPHWSRMPSSKLRADNATDDVRTSREYVVASIHPRQWTPEFETSRTNQADSPRIRASTDADV